MQATTPQGAWTCRGVFPLPDEGGASNPALPMSETQLEASSVSKMFSRDRISTSINPDDSGPCRAGEGVRWDTAALLASTTFKCTGAASEALKTAVTSDKTVVLQADFYRASNGNDESFTAKMIVSDGDIASDFPGVNLWVERVGCGPRGR